MNTNFLTVAAVCDLRTAGEKFVSIRVHSWLSGLRDSRERWNRLADDDPRQFIFEPDRFLRRKRRRVVERRDRHVDRF